MKQLLDFLQDDFRLDLSVGWRVGACLSAAELIFVSAWLP
jgi:hypothetical protein